MKESKEISQKDRGIKEIVANINEIRKKLSESTATVLQLTSALEYVYDALDSVELTVKEPKDVK